MRGLSVALHLIWLSAALGGVMGALFMAQAIYAHGPGVLWGYLGALFLFTLPAYQAEETALRLAGRPWVVAAADGMRMRHTRAVWLWVAGAVLLLLLLLASLMLAAAALVLHGIAVNVPPPLADRSPPPALGHLALILLLTWCLATARVPRLRAYQVLSVALALILSITLLLGLASWLLQPVGWLQNPVTGRALLCGTQYALLSSLLGLGVYYAIRFQPYLLGPRWSSPRASWPWALVLGQGLWTLGLLGWSQHWWTAHSTEQGLPWLLNVWPEWAGDKSWMGFAIVAIVLILGARIMLLPWRQWLYARFGGAANWPLAGIVILGCMFSLRLLLEHALEHRSAAQWSIELSAHLQGWAIPVVAVLMLSALIRSVPPAALVWAQPGSWIMAGLRYAYWRYVLRSVLILWIVIGSGWASRIGHFWQIDMTF